MALSSQCLLMLLLLLLLFPIDEEGEAFDDEADDDKVTEVLGSLVHPAACRR